MASTGPLVIVRVERRWPGLKATGGASPDKWKLVSSTLPKGLKLNKKTGVISGKPKAHAVGTDSF